MKANAPEKIYVDSKALGDDISTTVHTKRQDYPTYTEYIRTDAFIEKACDAYCAICDTKECCGTGECEWVEKFRKRLMK